MSLAESYSSRWRNLPSNRNICLKSQKKSKGKHRHSPLVCGWMWVFHLKANGRKSPKLSCFHYSASLILCASTRKPSLDKSHFRKVAFSLKSQLPKVLFLIRKSYPGSNARNG